MGIVRMGPPTELILQLKHAHALCHFIETGTYLGETAYWASQVFERVTTIEFSDVIYQQVKSRYAHSQTIEFLYGDTRAQLAELVPHLDEPSLFWLDAHWSGGDTYGQSDECPLLDEIAIINQSELEHVILIDDARLFTAPPPPPHRPDQWATISDIVGALNASRQHRYIVIVEDCIVAVPESLKSVVIQYCQAGEAVVAASRGDKRDTSAHPRITSDLLEVTGELEVINNLTHLGHVIFDLGAHVGQWTAAVLKAQPNAIIHAFEPVPQTYQVLLQNLADFVAAGRVVPVNCAIAHTEEIRTIYAYESASAWSTLHRRIDVEQDAHLPSPRAIPILTTTLDHYCEQMQVPQIHFLKIDVEGSEQEVLLGAKNLLKTQRIDYLQFEYRVTWNASHTSLKRVFDYLHQFRYWLFKILPDGLEYRPEFLPRYENFEYSNFLAVSDRLRPHFLDEPPTMLDLQQLCSRYGITPINVIHVGAHEGKEIPVYQAMGVQGTLLIEANPAVFERLEANLVGVENMLAMQGAVSDRDGTVTLHVTSADQSSSILPLKHHRDYYPDIQETHQITVPCTTLDSLLDELQLDPAEFNVLNLDIQGAELLALRGATTLLPHIAAINTEINYEELYEGCALVHQIDDFLGQYGFERVETVTPFHPSWGDAFYVKRPVITMSTLGQNGRFANQFFQYAFLKTYARVHGLRVETSPWIGQYLFGHRDLPVSQRLPVIGSPDDPLPAFKHALLPDAPVPYQQVEVWGYFQYHTRFYAPHKDYIRSLFQPIPEIEVMLQTGLQHLRARGKTIIGLHLRRGDYGDAPFFIAPSDWYIDWLQGFWETLEEPVLFIASDEPETVVGDFAAYNPVTVADLAIALPNAPFYPDFYILSHCDGVAISNSSFSFAACLLNQHSKFFSRPHLPTRKLIPFDPWNSDPIFR